MKKHSKILSIALSLLMLASLFVFPASAKTATVQATAMNVTRSEGALVIYTPEYGAKTGQNEWGYEVVVENNKCVSVKSGGNSTIPANGFVLSGHNSTNGASMMADWLRNNVSVGDYVFYNDLLTVTATTEDNGSAIFYSASHAHNGINSERGVDSLVVFNQRGSTTGTNEWGYEVVVDAGVITAVGGNNSTVPSAMGSFVISGHGAAADWLMANAKIGMSASFTAAPAYVTISYDQEAMFREFNLTVENLNTQLGQAKANYDLLDYDAIDRAMSDLQNLINDTRSEYNSTGSGVKLSKGISDIRAAYEALGLELAESRNVEYRAVWVRPTQTTQSAVDEYIETLYKSGINTVCVETLYDNCMIMPMPSDSLFEHHPQFFGFDVLQAYINACHERNMELHVWMPVFHVGNEGTTFAYRSVGTKKPEWLSVNNLGTTSNSSNHFMIDPTNKEAQAYLLQTYKYIVETYDIDSFQLDYIRFGARSDTLDFGYNTALLDAFEAQYGVRPTYDINASYWTDWCNFRAQYITDFVSDIRDMIVETKPEVLLGADVVPSIYDATSYYYQNYYEWLSDGMIDLLFPMTYSIGYLNCLDDIIAQAGDKAAVIAGLGTFETFFDETDMQEHTAYALDKGADGYAFFESSAYISKKVGEYIADGSFKTSAITPTLDARVAAREAINAAKKRINDIFVPLNAMTSADAKTVTDALTAFTATLGNNNYKTDELAKVTSVINSVSIRSAAKARLLEDLDHALLGYRIIGKTPAPDDEDINIGGGDIDVENLGDINGDGEINASDYTLLKRAVLGTFELSDDQTTVADINGDESINASDYTLLKRIVLGTYNI